MDFLRSSVLEMRSSLAQFQSQTGQDVTNTNAAPKSESCQAPADQQSDTSFDDIPEDIHDQASYVQNVSPSVKMDTAVRHRVSRPLSSKQCSSPASANPPSLTSKDITPCTGSVAHVHAPYTQRASTAQAPLSAMPSEGTVAALMRLNEGPRAAAFTVAGLGEGDGIMQRLAHQAQSMDGKGAAVLASILETLHQARHEGVNLTELFERLINTNSSQSLDVEAVPGSAQSLTECIPPARKATMRLPRGLLPEVLTKPAPHNHKNEVVLRLLGAHDDNSRVVRLQWIELLDQNLKQCALISNHLCRIKQLSIFLKYNDAFELTVHLNTDIVLHLMHSPRRSSNN